MKREKLFIALFPFCLLLFMCLTQEIVYLGLISAVAPYLRVTRTALLFLCGCIPITRRKNARWRPHKHMLLLFCIFSIVQLATVLIFSLFFSGYRDMDCVNYTFLLFLLAGSITLEPARRVHVRSMATLIVCFAVVWVQGVLLSTIYTQTFNKTLLVVPRQFSLIYILAFMLFSVTLGIVTNKDKHIGISVPVIAVGIVFIVLGCFSLFRQAGMGIGFDIPPDNPFGTVLRGLNYLDVHYAGYTHLMIFLGCWYATLLCFSVRKQRQYD